MKRPRRTLPSRDDAWTALADRLGGEVTRGRRSVKAVRFAAGRWVVLLDSYTQPHGQTSQPVTRWRGVYHAMDDFRFRIYRKTLFSEIGKLFGMQDIIVGQPDIDPDWIIRSNSEGRIQSLLSLREIVDALRTLRSGTLQAKPLRGRHRAPSRNVLELAVTDLLREADRLEAGCRLMHSTLDRMAKLGSAQPGEDVDLRSSR